MWLVMSAPPTNHFQIERIRHNGPPTGTGVRPSFHVSELSLRDHEQRKEHRKYVEDDPKTHQMDIADHINYFRKKATSCERLLMFYSFLTWRTKGNSVFGHVPGGFLSTQIPFPVPRP